MPQAPTPLRIPPTAGELARTAGGRFPLYQLSETSRGASADFGTPSTEEQLTQAGVARFKDPQDLDLRDREHALFSQHVLDQYGPVLGGLVVGASVPSYSGLKAAAQANPQVGAILGRLTGMDLANATPASWREIHAGLSPVAEMLKRAWRGRAGR